MAKNKKPQTIQDRIKHEEDYIAFLTKAVNSENFKRAKPAEHAESVSKLIRARTVLKVLKSTHGK